MLSVSVIDQAFVVPHIRDVYPGGFTCGGVVDASGHSIADSLTMTEYCHIRDIADDEVIEDDRTAIFIGNFNTIFGHALTDNLRLVWFLQTDECKHLLAQGAVLVYVCLWNEDLPKWSKDLLRLAGVELIESAVNIKQTRRFSKVYVPEMSIQIREGVRLGLPEYRQTIEKIRSQVDTSVTIDRVYFTRTGFPSKKDFGENAVEALFAAQGYRIISPEKLSIEQQIAIVAGCKEFCTTEGSISHLSVFCQQSTSVVILKKADFENDYQTMIDKTFQLNVTYLTAHHSIFAKPCEGPFYLYPTHEVLHYLQIDKEYVSYWRFMDWWRYMFMHYLKH